MDLYNIDSDDVRLILVLVKSEIDRINIPGYYDRALERAKNKMGSKEDLEISIPQHIASKLTRLKSLRSRLEEEIMHIGQSK